MSSKQEIWGEALSRSNKKKSFTFFSKVLYLLIFLAAVFYGIHRYYPNWIPQMSLGSETKTFRPELLWGNFSPSPSKISVFSEDSEVAVNRNYLGSLDLETLPKKVYSWVGGVLESPVEAKGWLPKITWLKLWEVEHKLSKKRQHRLKTEVNLENIRPDKKKWTWVRYDAKEKVIAKGELSEVVKNKDGFLELIVVRRSGRNGVAHHLLLDKKGLRQWAWKMRMDGHTLTGRVVRLKEKKYRIQTKCEGWSLSETRYFSGSDLLPGVWSPELLERVYGGVVILPHRIETVNSGDFFHSIEESSYGTGFRVSDPDSKWYEEWTPADP